MIQIAVCTVQCLSFACGKTTFEVPVEEVPHLCKCGAYNHRSPPRIIEVRRVA